MKKNYFKAISIILTLFFAYNIFILFFSYQVLGYNNLITHPLLSESAVVLYNKNVSSKITDKEKSWIIKGSTDEDNDPRYANHFYNPMTGKGLDAYDQFKNLIFKVRGQSAKAWVKAQNSATGDYSESAILKNYKEGNLARAYQGVGHILHLIQDMAVPAHTRNDPHAEGDPYEKWVEQYGIINPARLSFLSADNLDQAFDQVASYSNNNFFSKDTINSSIFNNYKIVIEKNNNLNVNYLVNNIDGNNYKLCKLDDSSIRLVCKINDDDLKLNLSNWNMLYPKAVGYSAGTIDYFVKQFELIDISKKEQEQLSFLSKLKNSLAWLKSEARYAWGDLLIAQRKVLTGGYDIVAKLAGEAQDNFKYFVDANKEIAGQAAGQAGRVLSAFESSDNTEQIFKFENTENLPPEGNNSNNIPPKSGQSPVEQEAVPFSNIRETEISNSLIPLFETENQTPPAKEDEIKPKIDLGQPITVQPATPAPKQIFIAGDSLAPETTITSFPAPLVNIGSAIFTFNSNEANSTFDCDLNAAGWGVCVTPHNLINLADGNNIFKVRAIDQANNIDSTPAEYIWRIDTLAPIITLTDSPAEYASSTDANFIFNSSESNSTFECNLDSSGWAICLSPKNYSVLAESAHNFKIKAEDQAGNPSATTTVFSWIIDLTSPQLTILSGPPDIASSTTASFQFNSSETDTAYQCKLDANDWQTCSASTTAASLIEGNHILEVNGADQAGNFSTSTAKTWLVDLTAATSTVNSLPATTTEASFAVSWSGTDADATGSTTLAGGLENYDVQYKIDVGAWQNWLNATISTSTIFNIAVSDNQTVYFRSRARDKAGNLGEWSGEAQTQFDNNLADYMVISEAQLSGIDINDEFIELYNPTAADIDLSAYSIQYRGSNSLNFYKKNFSAGAVIRSHGYYLIATENYDNPISADMVHTAFYLASSGGTIFLVNNNEQLTNGTAAGATVIDRLAYGAGDYLFPESAVYVNVPTAHKSLERKANATSTAASMATGGEHDVLGNSYDSDNNSNDFVLRNASDPKGTYTYDIVRVSDSNITNFGRDYMFTDFRPASSLISGMSIKNTANRASGSFTLTLCKGVITSVNYTGKVNCGTDILITQKTCAVSNGYQNNAWQNCDFDASLALVPNDNYYVMVSGYSWVGFSFSAIDYGVNVACGFNVGGGGPIDQYCLSGGNKGYFTLRTYTR